jgi:peroxiredoxin Q/BCP
VSFDTIEENKDFAEKFSFKFPLLCDTERAMGLAYGACESADAGNAARIGVLIGPEGKIKDFDEKANVKTYPTDVYQKI